MLARDSREKPVSTFSHPALDQARRLQDHKFIRQHPVGPFTVDFLCREAGLVLEVDGATHSDDHELEYDRRRTDYLRSQGYRVLRIQNADIYHRFDDVMGGLKDTLIRPSGTFSRKREKGNRGEF